MSPVDPRLRDRKILLVEDNPDDEELVLHELKRNGIANPIVVARDGQEALDLLVGSRATDFGLVLLDLELPKVHGLQVLQRLRGDPRTRLVPVIILTFLPVGAEIARIHLSRAHTYIPKPIEFGKFVQAVSSLGVYWLVLKERPQSATSAAGYA